MKKRNFLIGFLFGILFFFNGLIPIASAIEKNEYLSFGEGSLFYPAVEVGDIVYWSFETYNDEFNVEVSIDNEIISENKTSDSGSYIQTNSTYLMFINLDREWFRDGWIKIEISINTPLSTVPEPFEPYPIEKNDYFNYGGGYLCYPPAKVGDIVYWSFETYNDEFNVEVSIDNEIISENKTSDSGSYIQTNSTYLMFINLDREWFRDGWIKIEISINTPLSDDSEPIDSESNEYTIIISIVGGVFAIIIVGAVVILRKRKNERINQNTQDSKAGQKYRISPTIQESKVVGNYCQNCGQKNTIPNSKFCVNCGDNLNI